MSRRISLSRLAGCAAASLASVATASTIGVTNGNPATGAWGTATGLRERIVLEAAGGVLVGQSLRSSLEQVVLVAPGVERAQLMLREIEDAAGRKALHLAVEPNVAAATVRATLILREDAARRFTVLAEGPVRQLPAVRVETGEGERVAVLAGRLGAFRLVDNARAMPTVLPAQSAGALLGAGTAWAWLPVTGSLLFMLFARLCSVAAHRIQARRDG